jgi:hypothetical protein
MHQQLHSHSVKESGDAHGTAPGISTAEDSLGGAEFDLVGQHFLPPAI